MVKKKKTLINYIDFRRLAVLVLFILLSAGIIFGVVFFYSQAITLRATTNAYDLDTKKIVAFYPSKPLPGSLLVAIVAERKG